MLSKKLDYEYEIPKGTKFTNAVYAINELLDNKLMVVFEKNYEDVKLSKTIQASQYSTVEEFLNIVCSDCQFIYSLIEPNILKFTKATDEMMKALNVQYQDSYEFKRDKILQEMYDEAKSRGISVDTFVKDNKRMKYYRNRLKNWQ